MHDVIVLNLSYSNTLSEFRFYCIERFVRLEPSTRVYLTLFDWCQLSAWLKRNWTCLSAEVNLKFNLKDTVFRDANLALYWSTVYSSSTTKVNRINCAFTLRGRVKYILLSLYSWALRAVLPYITIEIYLTRCLAQGERLHWDSCELEFERLWTFAW